jgi:hypothetical protein
MATSSDVCFGRVLVPQREYLSRPQHRIHDRACYTKDGDGGEHWRMNWGTSADRTANFYSRIEKLNTAQWILKGA